MASRVISLIILLMIAMPLPAQTSPSSQGPDPSMQELLARIEQLEKKVDELQDHERKAAVAACAAEPRAVNATNLPQASAASGAIDHDEHTQMAAQVPAAEVHYPSLQFRGFGDVDFAATDQPGSRSGFNLGQFVLHMASPLSGKVSYFGELSLTARPTGYDVQVERTIIRYDYNDFFKLSFGKYHTPIGYWNTAFHHGAWLQTTISRPEMIQFGGTFIPNHFLGLEAEGDIPSGGAGLGYRVGMGNGRSSLLSTAGDFGDTNNNRAWVASVFARPTRLYGLQAGVSAYHDKLSPQAGGNFEEWITSAHLVWTKEKPEFLSEFANVHHRDVLTERTFNSQAFYVQLAYRLSVQENKWKPYYRFEYIHKPASDPVFAAVNDLVGSTLGLRYDITNYAAFKGEYRSSSHGINGPRVNGAFFQTAFTF